jgi:GDPmannose 4,6-dehydratase
MEERQEESVKTALIIGVAGQDGSYLTELLLEKGYEVHGIDKSLSGIDREIEPRLRGLSSFNLTRPGSLATLLPAIAPEEIYYLAAHHFSSQSGENLTGEVDHFLSVNLLAPNIILNYLKENRPDCRFFYACSSQVFGSPTVCPQTEATPHFPETPYAISKSSAFYLTRYYRETRGLHASTGILYNHESPRRSDDFITTKIALAAARAFIGKPEPLPVRDLRAQVDWGAAQDYVKAMWLALQHPHGDDYIIATGAAHTVKDFADEAFSYLGLASETFVYQDMAPAKNDRLPYIGDSSKIRKVCGWIPAIPFRHLVRSMVDHQINRLKATGAEAGTQGLEEHDPTDKQQDSR